MVNDEESMDEELTIDQIAKWAGVSVSTVRRKGLELKEQGAYIGRPAWRVTKRQAINAKLTKNNHQLPPDHSLSNQVKIEDVLRETLHRLERDLAREQDRTAALEEERAAEPDAALIDALKENNRTLERALAREQDRTAALTQALDQEKQEKMLWLQGYLSQTHQILPREDTGEDTQDDQPQAAPPTEPATRRKFSFRNLFRRT